MRKLPKVMLLSALIMGSIEAAAQQYSLDECLRIAQENNQHLKNSQLDVTASDHMIKEVKSELLPTINLAGQFQYYKDLPSQYAPASAFGGPEDQYNKLTLNMKQTTSASIQVTQNLYNQTVFTGLKAARVVQEASLFQVNVTRENLVYNVTATYYSIQVLNDNLKRLEENIFNLEKTVKVNMVLKDNELVSENIHNRMLINLENLRNEYENQKLLQDKNLTFLKNLMNIDMQQSVEVTAFDYSTDLVELDSGDISRRADIQLQSTQVRLSQFDKKNVIAGYYPVLTNSFTFAYAGYYDEFSPFKQINNDWIRSSYMQLTLKIPVFDGFRKHHQIKQKEVAIQKDMNTLSMMKSNAEKEIKDAIGNYHTNKNLWMSNKKSLALAEQLFKSSQSDYENGLSSITEFLDAQNDLSNARTNYSAALLNLKLAELSLKKANGTLINL
jgi:outer membrane protein